MKHIALSTAVVLTIILAALALWQMREAVQLLAISLAVASAVTPFVRDLTQRGMARGHAVALVFVLTLALLVGSIALFGALAYTELSQLLERAPVWYEQLRLVLLEGSSWMTRLGLLMPSIDGLAILAAGEQNGQVGELVLGIATSAAGLTALVISAATLGFYWLLDQQRIERLWLSLLPLPARTSTRAVWEQVYNEVGIYMRGEACIVAVTALGLLSVYAILDVPGPALLALIGGLAQIVPLLGVPAALLTGGALAFTQGPQTGGLALVGILYVLGVVKLVIAPRVFRAGINVNPVLVVFMIMALAALGGVGMILLAPPLAAALQVSVRVLAGETRPQPGQQKATHVEALRARLILIEEKLAASGEADPRLQALLQRAWRLTAETATSLPSGGAGGQGGTQ